MSTPADGEKEVIRQFVTDPRGQATNRAPHVQPTPPQPLHGKRIFFADSGQLAGDSFVLVEIAEPASRALALAAIHRLLNVPGLTLLNWLSDNLFDRKNGRYARTITLHFESTTYSGIVAEAGHVEPLGEGQTIYHVHLKNYVWTGGPVVWPADPLPAKPGGAVLRGQAFWPPSGPDPQTGKPRWCVMPIYYLDDSPSMMAECLYHELLHVRFLEEDRIRRQSNMKPRDYPTGHGDQTLCEIEPDFRAAIKSMVDKLNEPYLRQRPPMPGRYLFE